MVIEVVASLLLCFPVAAGWMMLIDYTDRRDVMSVLRVMGRPLTSIDIHYHTGLSIGVVLIVLRKLEKRGKVTLEETPATAERGWRPGIRATLVKR